MPSVVKSRKSGLKKPVKVSLVTHPPHYTQNPSGVECLDVTEHMTFNLGNAVKYIWRAGLKDPKKFKEDLDKAIFYVRKEQDRIERLRKKRPNRDTQEC